MQGKKTDQIFYYLLLFLLHPFRKVWERRSYHVAAELTVRSIPDIAPLFVHRNLCQAIDGWR